MKKFIILSLLFTVNCGWWNKKVASVTGYSKECVDGVTYLQFASGVVIQRDKNDKIIECK